MEDYLLTGLSTIATGLIVWLLQDRLRRKPNLFWSVLPRASFQMPAAQDNANPIQVNTEIMLLQNLGRATAEQCEVVLSYQPLDWQVRIVPNRSVETEVISEGHYSLKLGSLGPNELLQMHVYYWEQGPQVINVRTKDGPVLSETIFISKRMPYWAQIANLVVQVIGLFVLVLLSFALLFSISPSVIDWIKGLIG